MSVAYRQSLVLLALLLIKHVVLRGTAIFKRALCGKALI
jgi:hypothetical protein